MNTQALTTRQQNTLSQVGADPGVDAQAVEDRLANRSKNTKRTYDHAIGEFHAWL